MKKLLKLLSGLFIIILMLSCSSSDDVFQEPPVVIKPTPKPVPGKSKPAIVFQTGKSSKTGKSAADGTKRLKSISQYRTDINFEKWKLAKEVLYDTIPTNNIMDSTEIALNTGYNLVEERTYSYDASGNVVNISTVSPTLPESVDSFTFDEQNRINSYTNGYGQKWEYFYGENGLITSDIYTGSIPSTHTYKYNDRQDLISSIETIGIVNDSIHLSGQIYTYTHNYESNSFIKRVAGNKQLTLNKTTGEFEYNGTMQDDVAVYYDPDEAGLYKNEVINKVIFSTEVFLLTRYFHITSIAPGAVKPKYFYDKDGYLIKYDRGGKNNISDIYIFKYE